MLGAKLLSLIIFSTSYLLFIFFLKKRTLIAISASLVIILSGVLSLRQAFQAVNWNVMGIFVGTLIVADVFMKSRVPAYLAEIIVNRAKNTAWAILLICLMTGILSAFVENVATVLIVAPVALSLAKKIKLNPTRMMIAISISSNLQGAATLIGDPPSMLLAGYAGMNFVDFFFYKGRLSVFFAVELGAMASFIVLYLFFRHQKKKEKIISEEKVVSWVPSSLLIALIFCLALSSFIDLGFSYLAGLICLFFGIACALWDELKNRGAFLKGIKSLDWETTFFLLGIFVLVGSITENGWIDKFSLFLSRQIGQNILWGFIFLVSISIVFSAFVDNVPFLAAMLPVATSISEKLHLDPSLFLFGLLIGATLGGNITPIGASANVVSCGVLKKEGYAVGFKDFVSLGLPFTLAAVITASALIWILWR